MPRPRGGRPGRVLPAAGVSVRQYVTGTRASGPRVFYQSKWVGPSGPDETRAFSPWGIHIYGIVASASFTRANC